MEILNTVEFLSYISDKNFEFYRGQGNSEWELIPSLARIKNPSTCHNVGFGSWAEVEDYLVEEFQKQSIPFIDSVPKNKFDWLVHAQHHGLPTRLIDWSTNPLKSLFFAVENSELDDLNGIVYCCDASYWSVTDNVEERDSVSFFFSAHLNNRIIAQEGCFSLSPISDTGFEKISPIDENCRPIGSWEQVIIPKHVKATIRKELKKLGINHSSIYPGLDGISKNILSGFSAK